MWIPQFWQKIRTLVPWVRDIYIFCIMLSHAFWSQCMCKFNMQLWSTVWNTLKNVKMTSIFVSIYCTVGLYRYYRRNKTFGKRIPVRIFKLFLDPHQHCIFWMSPILNPAELTHQLISSLLHDLSWVCPLYVKGKSDHFTESLIRGIAKFMFTFTIFDHMESLWKSFPMLGKKGLKTLTVHDTPCKVLKITFVLLCLQDYNALRVVVWGSATLILKTDKTTIKMNNNTRKVQTQVSSSIWKSLLHTFSISERKSNNY